MKYNDLPNIRINDAAIINDDDQGWPEIQSNQPSTLKKHASLSCDVLTIIDDLPDMPERSSPYVSVPRPAAVGASSRASASDDYVVFRPRPSNATSDREDETDGMDRGMTDVAFRKLANQRKSGIPSKVYDVLFDYHAEKLDELELKAGSTVTLLIVETGEDGWFFGETADGQKGLFPATHVRLIGDEPVQIKKNQISLPPGASSLKECEIGKGGFAHVYHVMFNGHHVALKQLKEERVKKDIKEALKNEAVLINRLRHENVVCLFGVCFDAPFQGLVLELCEGQSLKLLLKSIGKNYIPVRTMVKWALQIADAMLHLSKNNCIHRDLKADNVLVKEKACLCWLHGEDDNQDTRVYSNTYDETGKCRTCFKTEMDRLTLKVTDFSDTRQLKSADEANRHSVHTVGTYNFLAPEAFKHRLYTEASDVWSYGVVLWEILTKQIPYENASVIVAFTVAKKGSHLEIENDCPMKWKDIMKMCWNLNPELRPTFEDIVASFREYDEELQADGVTREEELRLKESTRLINELVHNINSNPSTMTDYQNVYSQLINEINYAQEFLNRTTKEMKLENKAKPQPRKTLRKNKGKILKEQIGCPDNVQTIMSIRNSSGHLDVVLGDSREASAFQSDTLPRVVRKESPLTPTHGNLRNALSISSPNLNNLNQNVSNGGGTTTTLKRQMAIKRKQLTSNTFVEPTPERYAEVQVADPNVVEAITTPVRRPQSGSHDSRRDGISKIFSKIPLPLFKSKTKSTDDHDIPGHLPSSARSSISSTSSSRIAGFSHMTRSPIAPSFHQGMDSSRPRASSVAVPDDERVMGSPRIVGNKVSPTDKPKAIQMSQRPHAKSTTDLMHLSIQPIHSNSYGSIALDDPIPSSSDLANAEEVATRVRTHSRTPSDGIAGILDRGLADSSVISPPRRPNHQNVELSTVVPVSSGHSNHITPVPLPTSRKPVPTPIPDNPYVKCAPTPGSKTAVNNTSYIRMPSQPTPTFPAVPSTLHSPVTNNQYFNCPSTNPQRPDSLPLRTAVTPGQESSGISTGGSSFSPNAHDQPPLMNAPPPPRPPAIPPREGTVNL